MSFLSGRLDYAFTFGDEMRTVLESMLAVFVIFKLNGVIDWSWWWVTAPFTIPFTISLITAIAIGLPKYLKERKQKEAKNNKEK